MSASTELLVQPDRYPLSSRYDQQRVIDLDMGPHPLWQLEDLLTDLRLRPGSRVLDLGCGRGATSVFLARERDVDVTAVDLLVGEDDLRAHLRAAGVDHRVTASNCDARELPFEDGEFDAIVSVDAFEYFGTDVGFLPGLLRVLKPGGAVGMTTPALRVDPYEADPPAYVSELIGWECAGWHSPEWWARHWSLTAMVTNVRARMQAGGRDDWLRWARATRAIGEDPDGGVIGMLEADIDEQIGFAVVSAVKA